MAMLVHLSEKEIARLVIEKARAIEASPSETRFEVAVREFARIKDIISAYDGACASVGSAWLDA